MPDILIRNFPADDLELIDEQARRLGLTRAEFLRRQLQQTARRAERRVSVADLRALSSVIADLGDDEVMRDAWS